MHIRDQITLINSAKKVITFMGANCDNLSFTNKDCVFHLFMHPSKRSGARSL